MFRTGQSRRDFLKQTTGAYAAAALAATPTDLPTTSLWEASELVRTKRVSPKELTAACLARIQRLNPILNAFITVTGDQAMTDAELAEAEILNGHWRGPLHGIPVGLKDLFLP